MSKTPVLHLKNTLPVRRLVNLVKLLAASALAVYITQLFPFAKMENLSLLAVFVSFVIFMILMFIREDFDDTNIDNITRWALAKYDIRLSKRQASELIAFGNAEFGNSKYMLQLCLIERNGEFSLHRTRELEISEEKDNIGKRQ